MATARQSEGKKTKSSGSSRSSSSKTKSASSGSKSASKSTAKKTGTSTAQKDAIAVLKADHRAVEKLFSQFEKAKGEERKLQIFQQIAMELKVHTQIEEEILYPQSRDVLDEEDLVNEAIVEHQAAKDLMAQIEAMQPSDEMYEAKVTVLREMIEHHVEEEEKEYFPQLQKSEMDTTAVGEQLMARKQELMREMGDSSQATH